MTGSKNSMRTILEVGLEDACSDEIPVCIVGTAFCYINLLFEDDFRVS
jgi:hypothetical protein